MKVIGIDPGSRHAGYAVIEVQGKNMTYLESGVLKYDHIENFIDRLGYIYQSCEELMIKHKPDQVAFESLIYTKSVTALAKLAQARGAMVAALSISKPGTIFEYSPNLIKQSVSGHGHADKTAIMKALHLIFGPVDFKTHDESDALAVAVCHALNHRLSMPKPRPKKPVPKMGMSLSDIAKESVK